VQGRVDPADVAAWANGRLSYTAVDVSAVAADLSRLTGQDIAVDPAVSKRLFSGGFALGNRDANTLRRAAALMGLTVRATDDGWILEAPASGSK
jgi:transmembrane sensor